MRLATVLASAAMLLLASNAYAWRILDFTDREAERQRVDELTRQGAGVVIPSLRFLKDPAVAMRKIEGAGLKPVLVPGDPPAKPGLEGQVYATRPGWGGRVEAGSRVLILHHSDEVPVDAYRLADAIANQDVQLAHERVETLGLRPQLIEGVAAPSEGQVGKVYQAEVFGGRHDEDRRPPTALREDATEGPNSSALTDSVSRYILHGSRVALVYYGPVRPALQRDTGHPSEEHAGERAGATATASAEVGYGVQAGASAYASGDGCDDLTGTWVHDTPELDCESKWELYRLPEPGAFGPYGAQESGCCNAGGEARLVGHQGSPRLEIKWTCNRYCNGKYWYVLDYDCQSGQGMIEFDVGNNPPCTVDKRSSIRRKAVDDPDAPGAPGGTGIDF